MTRRGLLISVVALALATSACTASVDDEDGAGGGGGDLRIGQEYDLGILDPQVLSTVGDKQMTSNLFEGLVRYELGGVEIGPGLATEWETDEGGLVWTFQLREGVQFHKGYGELTASDVVFTFERLLSPELASPNASLLSSVSSVVAEDDYRVRMELSAPDPALLDKLASWYTGIVSEQAVIEIGEDFGQDPVGTGPYQFESWTPGQETVLTAFDEYWGPAPRLDSVTYKAIPDVTTRNNAFEAGEIDLIQVTDPDILARYEQRDDVELSSVPGLITRFFGLNSTIAPFDDPRVREAVMMSVDRQAMLDGLFPGISTPATGVLSPEANYALEDIIDDSYDPAAAQALLAEAGYPDGFDVIFSVPNIDRFTRPATVIQQSLAEVGIRVEIEVMESQSFIAALETPEGLPMFILSRGQEPAPDRILSTWFGSAGIPQDNWARINDPEIDQLLEQATTSLDEDVRADLFGQVQELVVATDCYYFIDHEDFIFATSTEVEGFVSDPFRSIRLDEVSLTG